MPRQNGSMLSAAAFFVGLYTAMSVPRSIHTDICENISPRFSQQISIKRAAAPSKRPHMSIAKGFKSLLIILR